MTKLLKRKSDEKQMLIEGFPFAFDSGDAESKSVKIPDSIHLIPIGQWEHDAYGPILITMNDIKEFVQHFDQGIRKGVFITAGHEGFEELPAVGWITTVEARDNGLWGMVEWNQVGKELLADKAFKFFSPEFYRDYEDPQTHELFRNVLTGGALTKSPYFKELEAVVFSDKIIKEKFNNNNKDMNLKDLLAKDITTLTDEEKAFIKSNAAELTDEEKVKVASIIEEPKTETEEEKTAREAKEAEDKKAADELAEKEKGDANEAAGLNRDGSEKQVQASEKKIMMSEAEVNALRTKANEGAEAFAELKKQKLTSTIKDLIFTESNQAGKFLPKSETTLRAFIETLNADQALKFTSLAKELPDATKGIFKEVGGAGAAEGTAQAELEAKVEAKMKANDKLKYSEALKEVLSENTGLEQRYDESLPSAKKVQG